MRGLTDAEYDILVSCCAPPLTSEILDHAAMTTDDDRYVSDGLVRRGLLTMVHIENVMTGRWLITWVEYYLTTSAGRLVMGIHEALKVA